MTARCDQRDQAVQVQPKPVAKVESRTGQTQTEITGWVRGKGGGKDRDVQCDQVDIDREL